LAAAVLLACLFFAIGPRRQVFRHTYELQPLKEPQRSQRILVPEPIELRARQNIKVTLAPRGSTAWAHIDGTLTAAQPAPSPGGAAARANPTRSEFAFLAAGGSRSVYLSSVPAGAYNLQFDLAWQEPTKPASVEVRIDQGVPHLMPGVLTLLLLGAVPLAVGLYQIWFEARRWSDSNVS
jgi:hypothetical protein